MLWRGTILSQQTSYSGIRGSIKFGYFANNWRLTRPSPRPATEATRDRSDLNSESRTEQVLVAPTRRLEEKEPRSMPVIRPFGVRFDLLGGRAPFHDPIEGEA